MSPTAVEVETTNSPTKSRKSFGISRKTSTLKLVGSEKGSTDAMAIPNSKEKKSSSSSILSYFFRSFRLQKTPSKKIPHTTALEQTEFTPQRKDSKIESDLSLSKITSAPSTPNVTRFSQALFVPPSESSSQISTSRRSSCDNPCLFLAFEQAIKSGVLTAPLIPPELIIKYQQDNEARLQKEKKSRFVRKGSLSKTLDVGWTQKLFILAPGLLLQYASDGPYDREPERILRLRSDSLAFATDVFEGKHFVLQVTSGTDATPLTPDEKRPSIMSRFGSKTRFDACVLLLVFEGAEEMQDWLVKIRKDISRLGGPNIEEHPQPCLKAEGTVFEEEEVRPLSRTPTNSRKSNDSLGKNCNRKSEEIAASMSTAMSRDGIVLDDLRTNSYNSLVSRERESQGSLETSPERSSVPDSRRRSTVSTTQSHSSTDLRIKSGQSVTSERPPSPTLTQISTYSFNGRRSTATLPAPIPIPVPSIPKRHSSVASHLGDLPASSIANRRVRRSRKSSAPPSPDRMIPLLSTSLPNPISPTKVSTRRPRPVSLASAPINHRRDYGRPQNLKRRSLGALSSAALGPPLHPPPSAPLPKLPDGTPGTFPKLPVSMLSPHHAIPPVPQIPSPIPHSPLALHAQSATDITPISRKQSIQSLAS